MGTVCDDWTHEVPKPEYAEYLVVQRTPLPLMKHTVTP